MLINDNYRCVNIVERLLALVYFKNMDDELSVTCVQCVPVGTMGRGVSGGAAVPITAPVIPSMALVNVTQDGSAVTALSVSSINIIIYVKYMTFLL